MDLMQEVIDQTDLLLVSVKRKYGAMVCESITDALKEIITYNPSGRHVIEVPWNYSSNKEATMKDIMLQLGEMIKQNDSIEAPTRKRNALS
jgi:hypothetical protein